MPLVKKTMPDLNRLSIEEALGFTKMPVTIVLENIRSGLNIGSVFRTADAMNVEKIILVGYSVVPPHREILKTALGSTQSVAWEYFETIHEALDSLKKRKYTIAAVEQLHGSISLEKFNVPDYLPLAVVLGNEVDGVSDAAIAMSDLGIEIPQSGIKHSMNISVCAGIILWHCFSTLHHNSV